MNKNSKNFYPYLWIAQCRPLLSKSRGVHKQKEDTTEKLDFDALSRIVQGMNGAIIGLAGK